MKLPVLSVADGADWEARLVAEFDRGPYPVAIVRRCVDVVDLLAVAASGRGRAALIDARVRRVDADALDRLHAADVIVVGVAKRGDSEAMARLHSIGIEQVIPDDADPAVVASVVSEAVRPADPDGLQTAVGTVGRAFAHPSEPADARPAGRSAVESDGAAQVDDAAGGVRASDAVTGAAVTGAAVTGAGRTTDDASPSNVAGDTDLVRRGSVIAVWGPTGAPGRTTVAVGLADELARLGSATMLVDADVYGGTVAAVVGVLDESPGFAAACRRAAGRRLDTHDLAALCWQVNPQLRILTGIPIASRWPELRPTAVGAVLESARALCDYVVVDCGFCLETDEELSFDTLAPRRNGATLAVLDAADLIVVVGTADPIGVQRLVRGLTDLQDTGLAAPTWVVLNRVRATAVAGDPERELGEALQRFAGRRPAAYLPSDAKAVDAAVSSGRTLAEAAPNSALRRGVAELAAALAGVSTPAAGRRRRRR